MNDSNMTNSVRSSRNNTLCLGECNKITEGMVHFTETTVYFFSRKSFILMACFLHCVLMDVISIFWRQVKPVYKPYVTGIYRSTVCFKCTVRINRQDDSSND